MPTPFRCSIRGYTRHWHGKIPRYHYVDSSVTSSKQSTRSGMPIRYPFPRYRIRYSCYKSGTGKCRRISNMMSPRHQHISVRSPSYISTTGAQRFFSLDLSFCTSSSRIMRLCLARRFGLSVWARFASMRRKRALQYCSRWRLTALSPALRPSTARASYGSP